MTSLGRAPRGRALAGALLACMTCTGAATAQAATWHVRSGAPATGDGSERAPFASLAAVESASGPGDTIVVAAVAADVPALDGGIALKPGQRLTGAGPAVTGVPRPATLPVLTNTDTSRLSGDGVRLADGATVSNLVIRDTARGGVYGLDSVGVEVSGNDVSVHNTSCTPGFLVQPFTVPTGVPGVGLGVAGMGVLAPQNGWAAIMVDGERATGTIVVTGNVVHDAHCGDGIDVRAAGTSDLTARIDGNDVARLQEGEFAGAPVPSVLAIGMQARDSGRLRVTQDGNSQTDIGSPDADCEGQFANTSESGVIEETVQRNTFRRGIGGFSCNGFEAVISNGGGSIDVTLRNSTFEDNPGDMLQAANLGAGSTMRWEMEHVVARRTTQRGANSAGSGDPGANPIPFNLGDCMVVGHTGGGNSTTLRMRDSVLEGCNNGVNAQSGLSAGNGVGIPQGLVVDIARSRIAGHDKFGLAVANLTPLRRLQVRLQDTEIVGSRGFGVGLDEFATATTDRAELDLGGGSLGSTGGNCLQTNAKGDVEASQYAASARGNWWGQPGGPRPGQVVLQRGGTVDVGAPLATRPGCGPRPPSAASAGGPTGMRVRVTPGRDRRAPHRFTTTGTVIPPPGVDRAVACRGRVTVQVKAGRNTISNRRATLTPACRFRSTVSFAARRRFGRHRRLGFTARFAGNAVLARRTARPIRVAVR